MKNIFIARYRKTAHHKSNPFVVHIKYAACMSSSNPGRQWRRSVATLAYAISRCVAAECKRRIIGTRVVIYALQRVTLNFSDTSHECATHMLHTPLCMRWLVKINVPKVQRAPRHGMRQCVSRMCLEGECVVGADNNATRMRCGEKWAPYTN